MVKKKTTINNIEGSPIKNEIIEQKMNTVQPEYNFSNEEWEEIKYSLYEEIKKIHCTDSSSTITPSQMNRIWEIATLHGLTKGACPHCSGGKITVCGRMYNLIKNDINKGRIIEIKEE